MTPVMNWKPLLGIVRITTCTSPSSPSALCAALIRVVTTDSETTRRAGHWLVTAEEFAAVRIYQEIAKRELHRPVPVITSACFTASHHLVRKRKGTGKDKPTPA
jgi:hypothetical protein